MVVEPQLGSGALFGGGGAPITGGGAQIIGGGAGLRRAPAQFNPCLQYSAAMHRYELFQHEDLGWLVPLMAYQLFISSLLPVVF